MNQLQFFAIIIESCLVDSTVDLTFNWSYEEFEKYSKDDSRVAKTFPYLSGSGWTFKVTKDNKTEFLKAFFSSFTSADFCHFTIKYNEKEVGQCYNNADANFLNPVYFDRILLASKLDDEEIEITFAEE